MLKYLDEVKQTLEREIDKIAKTGDISVSTLEKLHKLTDTYKNLCKIAMLSEEEEGEENSYEGGSSYRRGRGRNARRDRMGRYSEEGYSEEGNSYERGGQGGGRGNRGGRGGNSSYEGGYSRDGAKDYMIDKLEEMMEEVENPKERKALMECLQALERA